MRMIKSKIDRLLADVRRGLMSRFTVYSLTKGIGLSVTVDEQNPARPDV